MVCDVSHYNIKQFNADNDKLKSLTSRYKLQNDISLSAPLMVATDLFQRITVVDEKSIQKFYQTWKQFRSEVAAKEILFTRSQVTSEKGCCFIFQSLFSCCLSGNNPQELCDNFQEVARLDDQIEKLFQEKKLSRSLKLVYANLQNDHAENIFLQLVSSMNENELFDASNYLSFIDNFNNYKFKIKYINYLLQLPVNLRESLFSSLCYLERKLNNHSTFFQFLDEIQKRPPFIQKKIICFFDILIDKLKSQHLYKSIFFKIMHYSDQEIELLDTYSRSLIEKAPNLYSKFKIFEQLTLICQSKRLPILVFLNIFTELKIDEYHLRQYISFLQKLTYKNLEELGLYLKGLARKIIDIPFLHQISSNFFIYPIEFMTPILSHVLSVPVYKQTSLYRYIMLQLLLIPLDEMESRMKLLNQLISGDLDLRDTNILIKTFFYHYQSLRPILSTNVLLTLTTLSTASNRIQLLFKLKNLNSLNQEKILYLMHQLTPFASNEKEILLLFDKIVALDDCKKEEICEQLLVYLLYFKKENSLDALFQQLLDLSFSQKKDWLQTRTPLKVMIDFKPLNNLWNFLQAHPGLFLNQILPHFHRLKKHCFDSFIQSHVIFKLIEIPINELEERVSSTLRIAKRIYGKNRILKVFDTFSTLPLPLTGYIELLEPFLALIYEQDEKVAFIKMMSSYSLSDLELIHQDQQPFFKYFSNNFNYYQFFNIYLSLDPIQKKIFCENANCAFRLIYANQYKIPLINTFVLYKHNLAKACELFDKINHYDHSESNYIFLFSCLANLSDETLEELESIALDLLKQTTKVRIKGYIIQILVKCPSKSRQKAISILTEFINIKNSESEATFTFLKLLANHNEDHYVEKLEHYAFYFSALNFSPSMQFLLFTLKDYTPHELREVRQFVTPLYLSAKKSQAKIGVLIMALHMQLSKHQICLDNLIETSLSDAQKENIDKFLIFLHLIPTDQKNVLQQIISHLFERDTLAWNLENLFHFLYESFYDLYRQLPYYILERLASSHHSGYINFITHHFIENPAMIGISLESQEHQLLLSYYLESMHNKSALQNPYQIYAKQVINSRLPLLEFPSQDGYKLSSTMLKSLYPQPKSISVSDLKAYLKGEENGVVSFENFKQLCNSLLENFKQSCICHLKNQKKIVTSEIVEVLELKKIIDCFNNDPLIISFWAILDRLDEYEITIDHCRFFVLMKFLFSKDNSLKLSQNLTLREELCIQMLHSIQFCKAGKVGGIKEYYDVVVKEFPSLTDIDGAYDLAPDLRDLVMENFELIFNNQSILKQILGFDETASISQVIHQILFLKNSLGVRLGLHHHLQFDLHTEVLISPLLALLDNQEAIANAVVIIDRYFNAFQLAQKIDERINALLQQLHILEVAKEELDNEQEQIVRMHPMIEEIEQKVKNLNTAILKSSSSDEIKKYMHIKNQLADERRAILTSDSSFNEKTNLIEANLMDRKNILTKLKNLGFASKRQNGLSILVHFGLVINA